jgi:hypothetical protein
MYLMGVGASSQRRTCLRTIHPVSRAGIGAPAGSGISRVLSVLEQDQHPFSS